MAESKKTYMVAQAAAVAAAAATAADDIDESPQKGKGKKGKGKAAKSKAVKGKHVAAATPAPAVDGKKQAANVLMQLRKAADHPLLFRKVYRDDKLRTMSKDIMKVSWLSPGPQVQDRVSDALFAGSGVLRRKPAIHF